MLVKTAKKTFLWNFRFPANFDTTKIIFYGFSSGFFAFDSQIVLVYEFLN